MMRCCDSRLADNTVNQAQHAAHMQESIARYSMTATEQESDYLIRHVNSSLSDRKANLGGSTAVRMHPVH